jgi:hypothetical protein
MCARLSCSRPRPRPRCRCRPLRAARSRRSRRRYRCCCCFHCPRPHPTRRPPRPLAAPPWAAAAARQALRRPAHPRRCERRVACAVACTVASRRSNALGNSRQRERPPTRVCTHPQASCALSAACAPPRPAQLVPTSRVGGAAPTTGTRVETQKTLSGLLARRGACAVSPESVRLARAGADVGAAGCGGGAARARERELKMHCINVPMSSHGLWDQKGLETYKSTAAAAAACGVVARYGVRARKAHSGQPQDLRQAPQQARLRASCRRRRRCGDCVARGAAAAAPPPPP